VKIDLQPIQQEKPYTCLPACLRIVLHYLGVSLTEEEIADECNTTEVGTTLTDAVHAVHSLVEIVKEKWLSRILCDK